MANFGKSAAFPVSFVFDHLAHGIWRSQVVTFLRQIWQRLPREREIFDSARPTDRLCPSLLPSRIRRKCFKIGGAAIASGAALRPRATREETRHGGEDRFEILKAFRDIHYQIVTILNEIQGGTKLPKIKWVQIINVWSVRMQKMHNWTLVPAIHFDYK